MSVVPRRLRQQVSARAQGVCEYCRNQVELLLVPFEADHILPRAHGGETTIENLALSCPLCNEAKATKYTGYDLETRTIVRLFNPRQQVWEEHFRWSSDFGNIIGKTPVGRATIQALDMNRLRVVLMRLRWRKLRLHPPRV